jgi:hypothetical protein
MTTSRILIPFVSKLYIVHIAIFHSDRTSCCRWVYGADSLDDDYKVSWILRELYRIGFDFWNGSSEVFWKTIGSETDRNGYCGKNSASTPSSPAYILWGEEHPDRNGLLEKTDVPGVVFNSAGASLMQSAVSKNVWIGSKECAMWPKGKVGLGGGRNMFLLLRFGGCWTNVGDVSQVEMEDAMDDPREAKG